MDNYDKTLSQAEVARIIGVSRTYISLLIQGKRQPSQRLANKLRQLATKCDIPPELSQALVGKEGLEPSRIAAPDPKSGPSASSGTPPQYTGKILPKTVESVHI
jgi:transcriptional regulator with XRE-family HTH domain